MAGAAPVCPGDERIRGQTEHGEADESRQLRGRRSSGEDRKQAGGCRRDGQRQDRSLDPPPGAPEPVARASA
jgi:hypothetical protein